MLRQLLVGLALFVSPAYAGMCGSESDGTVKCTDDAGRNSTLQSLDNMLVSPGGVVGRPDYSLNRSDMATYPKDTKIEIKPARPESEPAEKSDTTTFITPGAKALSR